MTLAEETEVDQQLADEDYLLGGEHGAKELCLGARERDGSLHLGEPMEEASVEKEHATGARKFRGPPSSNRRSSQGCGRGSAA